MAKNYVEVVERKMEAQELNKNLEKKLQAAQSQMQHFQANRESIRDLKRQVNELLANKELNERAESRYHCFPLCVAFQHPHHCLYVCMCICIRAKALAKNYVQVVEEKREAQEVNKNLEKKL